MKQNDNISSKRRIKLWCLNKTKNIFMALTVRLFLLIHTILAYWRVWSAKQQSLFWLFLMLPGIQVLETIYTVVKRKGVENAWFCLCFFCYLLSTIPAIYLLEFDRLNRYAQIYESENGTQLESLKAIHGVTLPFTLAPDIWVSIIEQSMLFLMVLGRIMLPRGKLSRDQLSQLLFVYIGMASDNSELFVLFDESPVRQDRDLTIGILVAWTFSLMLFTVVLTATKSSKKSRVAPRRLQDDVISSKRSPLRGFFETEIWSIVLTFLLQDGPYLSVRLSALIRYRLITYSILFFTFKNIFVIILLIYRLLVLFGYTASNSENDGDDEENKTSDRNEDKISIIDSGTELNELNELETTKLK
ncbi:transmembrane protein 26-like [Gigantopelta aegis]|uniref:transmembrane protein 26-like n=1 Tax=Gigantopelta aegis TaxID=1735272 RepID=UPI001B88A37B|nr:transmembrane protein 26-like [Gigantopelta aegis]